MTTTYDYIVVGAGSSGCALAARLSEDSGVRVLLLEAGPPPDYFWIGAPAGMAMLFQSDRFNWRYFSEPAPSLGGRKLYWPRGKTLGGTSAINGMVYIRGNPKDFEHWAALGNEGWSWTDVLPYFQRSERNLRGPAPNRGTEGPLAVSDPQIKHPSSHLFIEAAHRAGIPINTDLNGPDPEGVGFYQHTIDKGVRCSSYEAYLAPVRNRRNLTVITSAHARRIVVQERRAIGVEVLENGQVHTFHASREVILASGALGSPHLLMLSGIGDGDALRQHGISTVAHLPGVGKNLQDHYYAYHQVRAAPGSSYNHELRGLRKYWQGVKYVTAKRGYLALGASQVGGFVRSRPDMDYADLQLGFRPMTFSFTEDGKMVLDPFPGLSASICHVRPATRGQVSLRSPDPLKPAAFFYDYLSHPSDVEAMLAGMHWLRAIFSQEPIRSLVRAEIAPGPSVTTDEQLIDFLRAKGNTVYHPVGTCKMGSDPMAVVDARLRVHGIERLRVADASVMPTITSGNTNAPAIMIGEKAADMVRQDAMPVQ